MRRPTRGGGPLVFERRTGARAPSILDTKARRELVLRGAGLQLLIVWVELEGALEKGVLFFADLGVREATLDRADCLAGLVVIEPDALGAQLGIDHVDLVAFADRLIRALGLARAAVDAV